MCSTSFALKKVLWLALAVGGLTWRELCLGSSAMGIFVQVFSLLTTVKTLFGTTLSIAFIILFDLFHNPYHAFLLPIIYIVGTERIPRWRRWSVFQLLFFPAPGSSYSYDENEQPVRDWNITTTTTIKRVTSTEGRRDIHWIEISGEKSFGQFSRSLIVYFHGNGADCGYVVEKVAAIQTALNSHDKDNDWWAISIEYPGYGPGEWGVSDCYIVPDAIQVLQKYWNSGSWQPSNTIIIGSSIGTGPACQIGAIVPNLRHVALISPYTSLVEVARDFVFPNIPGAILLVRLLIGERFNNRRAVKSMMCSLSLHHGVFDSLIPVTHSRDLFENHRWNNKVLHELQCGHHNIPLEQFNNKLCEILFRKVLVPDYSAVQSRLNT